MNAAAQIQCDREAADLANHRERIQWLSAPNPKWACGVPVDGFTRRTLLNQSKEAVRFYAQRAQADQKGGSHG